MSRGRAAASSSLFLNFLIILFILFGNVWLFTKLKLSSLEEKKRQIVMRLTQKYGNRGISEEVTLVSSS